MAVSARRLALLAAVLLAGALVSACGASPGSAAVVGSTAVAESTILAQTQTVIGDSTTAGAADTADASAVNRTLVQTAIRHNLIDVASAEDGIQVSAEDVNKVIAQSGTAALAQQLQVPASAVSDTVHDLLVLDQMIAKLPTAGTPVTNVTVTIEGVPAASRADAVSMLSKYLGDPNALTKAVAAAGQQAIQQQKYSLLSTPQVAQYGLYHAAVGDIVLIDSGGQYLVVKILTRSEQPAMLTQQDFAAQQQQQGGDVLSLATLLLGPVAKAQGVSVNPRFGDWDPLSVQVVPGVGGW